jgi:cyclophilin family peptidyl-prolyl cis-trans isomerase
MIEEERRRKRLRFLGLVALIIAVVVVGSATAYIVLSGTDGDDNDENPIVVIKTDYGDIEIELYMDETPETAGNFKKLVERGFYNGLKFHRIIENFMIQGGDPQGDGSGGPGYSIDDEPSALALVHDQGVISMANSGPNTGGSQFFIVTNPDGSHHLDGKHAVFGKVTKGMNVALQLEKVPVSGDRPINDVIMRKVSIK